MSLPTLSKTKRKANGGKAKINASGFLIMNVVLRKKEEEFRKKTKGERERALRKKNGCEEEEWLKSVFQPIEISRCLLRVRWKSAKGPNEDAECNPDECNSSGSNSSEYGAEAGRAQENYDQFQISNAMS